MVFESVVTDVLNKVIGDYVENLDRNQLKIGIWGGDVVLKNLSLRENALDELDLPVQLIYGYLGKLVLNIPWKNLYKQPVVVQIEDFYALVAPKQAVPYDAEKEEKYELQAKQTALAALDEARKRELEKDKPKPDATFTEKLTAQIINNLQVKVANVHIRYEDTSTTGRPFAFGISLYELDFYTTDENWMKKYLTEQVDRVFKIGNLDSLSAYMNCAGELFSKYEKSQMAQLFRDNIARKDMAPPRFTYVLGPISSVAKLQMNMTPEYNNPPFAMPKIDLCLEMERLNVGLTSTQFQDIIKLMETMNRMQLGMPYRKYRPYNKPYKGHYKEWWKFAITAVLEEDVRKRRRYWTWEYMKAHRHMCNTYAERYKERELSKKPSASLITTCDLLETKLDLFNLLLIRQRVQIELEKERARETLGSTNKQSTGWFSGWWGGGKTEQEDAPANLAKKIEAAMTDEEKNKLYSAIGYEENATPANVPLEYVALSMNFRLEALTFGLYDDEKQQLEAIQSQSSIDLNTCQTIALLEFSLASASIKQRPAASAISITAGVRQMKMIGIKSNNYVPTLIESISMDGTANNLMDVFFETNPLDNECDKRIRVSTNSLRIVYDAETVLSLIKVFSPPKSVNLSELEGAAASKVANVKQRSATGMKYIIDKRELLEIDIKFQPNVLIVPREGVFGNGEHSMIILSLGALNISSKPDRQRDVNIKELIDEGQDIMENILKQAYDSINVSIENIQLLVAKPYEDWQGVLAHARPHEMHVLSPTAIKVGLEMCVIKDDPRLPLNKINILLPEINLHVTEERIFEALKVVFSIPLPEGDSLPESGALIRAVSSASRLSVASLFNAETKRATQRKTSKKWETAILNEDIIQFTDLELKFALNAINVSLVKSCFKDCPESPTASNFDTPTDENEEFHDSQSQLEDITDSVPLSQQKLLNLQIKQLEAQFAARTYEVVAEAKLGAISLQQYAANDSNKSVDIIDTPRFNEQQQYLLTVNFLMANKKSPEFLTKYNCTEQMIVVKFTTLNIILHQEYLLHLLTIADNLQRRFEAICTLCKPQKPKDRIASAADTGVLTTLTTIIEERTSMLDAEVATLTGTSQHKKRQRHADVVHSIKTHVQAELEQVSLLLACDRRPLARLKVEQFSTHVLLKSSYTELNLGLKNITVTDLNPSSIHTNILSIVGNDVLSCQVVLYNLEQTSNYNKDNMKINVEIGCMKIVFLNWFVTSILNFLNHFQTAVNALAQASAAAAETAKQSAVEAYAQATRMKLNIKMKAPIIVVPVHSQSFDAIALDLGMLALTNTITELDVEERDDEDNGPVLDEIKLELKNLKLSKVAILGEHRDTLASTSTTASVDTIDIAYGLHANLNILDPITFGLTVKRNLSSGWYTNLPELDISGRLKSIELNLFLTDYALIMSILHHNLTEGQNEFEPPEKPIPTPKTPPPRATQFDIRKTTTSIYRSETPKPKTATAVPPAKKVREQLKFSFLFDGVVANLMHGPNDGVARFGIHILSVKGSKLIDGTLSSSVVLCNIQIDDTRKDVKSKITKYLCRKDWKSAGFCDASTTTESILERCQKQRNFMLDITAIIKENDTFAEVRVCGFDLILCVDYLLSLADFFKMPDEILANKSQKLQETPKQIPTQTQTQTKQIQRPSSIQAQSQVESKINLMLFIEEPDIILVESLEDINTNAIIFNMQAQLNYRGIGDRQIINGQIDGMKMYMCAFLPERRDATKHFIIYPCLISLQGSTPEEEGLHISLKLSNIIINVSPATIELLNKASKTLSANSPNLAALPILKKDYSKIWQPSTFKDRDHWFVKVDTAYDALEMPELNEEINQISKPKSEKCVLDVPSITLVVEMGIGYYTTPLIMLDTSLEAVVSNWSSSLGVKGSLSLSMNYFNQELATWEPIIEPNEIIRHNQAPEYSPWQLNFDVDIESKRSEFEEDVEEKTTRIKIHSEETLELTMSKTCLDLLGVLSEAFSQAIDPSGLVKPEIIAPYVIENDTGFDIIINFERGIFTLHELHMPTSNVSMTINRSLVFKADELKDMQLTPDMVKTCQISPGGRAYLQTKDESKLESPEDEEYNIYAQLGGIDKKLILPISKSDTRYFPLYRDTFQTAWGVVSQVRSEHGTTTINLHGVVNVENHFTTDVKIYRYNSQTKQKTLVGEVAAGKVFHVPMHAIYADHKELYFSLTGYNISVQGVVWNDSPTDLEYRRQLQCDPETTFEPLYINVVREKTEIYHEHTNKFKLLSAFYTLHLRPPLYLRNALPINIRVSVAGCSCRTASNNLCETEVDALDAANEVDGSKFKSKEDLLDYGEKEVEPGDCLHLPTVKLSSKGKESKSYLVVRLIHYLEKDWSCTTEISDEPEAYTLWKFSSYDSAAKMDMDLCVRFEKMHGSLTLIIYSPFWMINKTGLMLSYKSDSETVDVFYHPPEYAGPILFSFRDKFFGGKKRAAIRVDNGDWSSKIPLDVAGSFGSVTCNANDTNYQIGVHNYLCYNSLTKQITFIPYYVATNKCKFSIELQEQSRPGDPWLLVEPDACTPIWPRNDSDNMIVARVDGLCTAAFRYTETQCTLLKLENSTYGGLNVDVHTTEGGIYITFTEYNPGDAPGLLVNHSSKEIVFYEKDKKTTEHVLKKRQKMLYAWNDPVGSKILVFGKNKVESDLRRDGVGELILANGQKLYWVSFLDGLQRVLLFTEIEAIATKTECSSALQSVTQSVEVRIHGIGLSVVNNEAGVVIMYLGITSSGVIWESKKPNKSRYKQLKIQECAQLEAQYQQYLRDRSQNEIKNYTFEDKYAVDFDRMLLMKSTHREIRRTFYPGVWVLMNTSPFQLQLHAKINKIQLDNQLNDCIFPVVLAPIAPPKSVATSMAFKPFIECSVVERVVPNSNVKQYKYATVLIQEFHFKVDLLFLNAIATLFTNATTDEQAIKRFNSDVEMIQRPLSELVATHSLQEQKNFYDNLHLGPLKIHVSFSMAGSDTTALPSILSTLVQGVGVTLTDVNDVVFRLAYFEREFQFLTQRQLISEITTHYTGQALKQLYVLVLGLDVLGNPYGLVVGLKKGVEDLFYEPFQGAIQGPGEFAEGLVLGVKSLFGHTVGGAAGAFSKITGAMGKGLAALTFDEDYQRKRRQAMNVKPKNFHEGIARSGRGLVMGFVDGVTGVVTKPVTGAREEGVEGFFKGLGKGAVGLVTRPTAGIVDFTSGSLEAVKQATSHSEDTKRLRAPRFLHQDRVLRPYSRSEANGNKLLKEIERGKYANTDNFIYCEELTANHAYVLLSNHRIIFVTKNDLFGTWNVQWTFLWNEIGSVSATERGVQIELKKEGKKVFGLFSSNETQKKYILISSRDRIEKFMEQVQSLRSED